MKLRDQRPARAAFGWARRQARRPLRTAIALIATATLFAICVGYGQSVYAWRQAQIDFAAKRYPEASGRLESCRRVWAGDPDFLLLAAKTGRHLKAYGQAELDLNRYLAVRPQSREAAQVELLLLRAQSGDEEAIPPLFELVQQRHAESAEILETVCFLYVKRFRYQIANASLTKWIELFPDQALPYDWRGWVYERTTARALAIKDYDKALELDPTLTHVRMRLVELLLKDNRVQEVSPHLQYLIHQHPDRPDIQARVGMLRFLQGESREARRLLEQVEPRLDVTDVAPIVYLARLDVQEGRGGDAESRLTRLIALDPTDTEARFILVAALRLQGRECEAQRAEQAQAVFNQRNVRVNELLSDRADRPDATPDEWSEVGRLFLEMSMEARALYWFDKALARDPNHQATHRVLAEYYDRTGKPDQAASHRHRLR